MDWFILDYCDVVHNIHNIRATWFIVWSYNTITDNRTYRATLQVPYTDTQKYSVLPQRTSTSAVLPLGALPRKVTGEASQKEIKLLPSML